MLSKLNTLTGLYHWFFPPIGILCHSPSDTVNDICQACLNELPILPQSCPQCAKTLPEGTTSTLSCGQCLKFPPPFDATYALFSYEPPITKMIMGLKFSEKLVNARVLGALMADAVLSRWYVDKRLPHLIMPVPLHPKRLQERGFNQALEIGRTLTKRLDLPMDKHGCSRIKHTSPQATLAKNSRNQNMKNAFQVHRDYTNQHIALLDDVTTTGQTLTELSKALKKAGAAHIDIWCCAKTLLSPRPTA